MIVADVTKVFKPSFEPRPCSKNFEVDDFGSTGVVQITYFEKGVTIGNQRYINDCFSPMIQDVESKRPHVHINVRNFLESKGLKEINHPPYSPHLEPCEFGNSIISRNVWTTRKAKKL